MADVTGPINRLPGQVHLVPEGQMCDNHPERKAISRIQGETDSFGAELHDMCEECLAAHRAFVPEPKECPACKATARLFPWRDYTEGSSGPVYYYCRPCIQSLKDEFLNELDDLTTEDDFYGDDSDYDFVRG